MVSGGSKFHLEPGTIHPCWNLLVPDVLDAFCNSRKLHSFCFVIERGVIFSAVITPVLYNFNAIEEHRRCFRLGSYFMAAVLAAAS